MSTSMLTTKFVFKHSTTHYSGNYYIHSTLELFKGDINEKYNAPHSLDNDRLIEKDKYVVREITLPDYIKPELYIEKELSFKWLFRFGIKKESTPESHLFGFMNIVDNVNDANLLAIIKLYNTKNFRSTFRKSLYNQLIQWLETPEKDRKYKLPFSYNQLNSMINKHIALEAKELVNYIQSYLKNAY